MSGKGLRGVESPGELVELLLDLHGLVEAGMLVEVRRPGEPSRYALSERGEMLSAERDVHELPLVELPWPEPCPACGAREGFDGGARCRRCRVAWPPEM